MTDEDVKRIVRETVQEIKKQGLLNNCEDAIYRDVSEILRNHYQTEPIDQVVEYAIQSLRFDPYFRIIPMYYEQKETIENIADLLNVDVSTVIRNKKRLCLKIYEEIS